MVIFVSLSIGIIAFCIAIGYKCYYPAATDKDLVEKVAEAVVKEETGVNISIDKPNEPNMQ